MNRKLLPLSALIVGIGAYVLRKRRYRRWAVRPSNVGFIEEKRQFQYFLELKENDEEQFIKYTRMTPRSFDLLLGIIEGKIRGTTRRAMPPAMKLAITLQYLTQGTSKQKEAWSFEIGHSTVGKIIDQVVDAITDELLVNCLPKPNKSHWSNIAQRFEERWNIPNAIGALDGKHIHIQKPWNSGSLFFNYKKTFSVILMATVDADYRFTVVDIGSYGGNHDSGIFNATQFGAAITEGTDQDQLDLPRPRRISGMEKPLSYFLLADDAFPLRENIMKPFGGKGLSKIQDIFNYRLSRGRRVVESAFGILASRFRILKTPIIAASERIEKYVMTMVILHNFILNNDGGSHYIPPGYADTEDKDGNFIPGAYRLESGETDGFQAMPASHSRHSRNCAITMRDDLAKWFSSQHGFLPWQDSLVTRENRTMKYGKITYRSTNSPIVVPSAAPIASTSGILS